jgi:hypothetical protein
MADPIEIPTIAPDDKLLLPEACPVSLPAALDVTVLGVIDAIVVGGWVVVVADS